MEPGRCGGTFELTKEQAPGVQLSIAASFKKLAPGRFAVSADIPLKDLEPGGYAVRLTLRLPGQEPHHLTRRFVIASTPNS